MSNHKNDKIELKPHQKLPIEFLKDNRGLILYHSTGSGKTITAIRAMYQFEQPIVIIGQKSSKKAFYDDIKKLHLDDIRFVFYTFAKIKRILKTEQLDVLTGMSVIIDEAHNLRNETTDNLMIISALEFAERILLLTATPVINYLNDLSVLVNIVKNQPILPTDIKSFNASYYDEDSGDILNRDTLVEKLQNCISYYDHYKNKKDYPSSTTEYIEIDMNDAQLEEYRFYIKKFFYDQPIGSGVYNIDFENINQQKKNFFLSATRQLSNTIKGGTEFPKIQAMYKKIKSEMKKGKSPCIVYSNYLKNGVHALTPLLEKDNIMYKTITGESSNEKINHIVNEYNKGKYDILLLTSAGSESLDLKNTRQIHIMEPHWNESRIKQVIGRAIRYESHSNLPKSERNITIYRWVSVFPELVNNKSADEYLIELSKKKDKIFHQFDGLIKDVAIENTYGKMKLKRVRKNKQKGGSSGILTYSQKYLLNKSMYIHLLT